MSIYKSKDIATNINERGVDLGNINVIFYSMDKNTTALRIFIKKEIDYENRTIYSPINLNQTKMTPRLVLVANDGSIFYENVDVIDPENGVIQYQLSENVIKHTGKMEASVLLIGENNKESSHAADFYFYIKESRFTGAIGKEVDTELLEDIVAKIMSRNAMGIMDQDFLDALELSLKDYIINNPEQFKMRFSDLTYKEKQDLISEVSQQASQDFAIKDNSITGEKIANKAITPEKTSFMTTSKNLFDESRVYLGRVTNTQTGDVEAKTNWVTTNLVAVENGVNYARNKNAEIVTFDEKLNYYGSYGNSTEVVKFAKDVRYVRLNIESKNVAGFQFEQADKSTPYEPYGVSSKNLKISNSNLTNDAIDTNNIVNNAVTTEKTNFIVESDNLFNNQNILFNKNLGDTNVMTDNTNYITSDYIQVKEGETYRSNNKYYGYVIYDANKKYITGRGQYLDNVTIPNGGTYIRLTIMNKWLPGFQFYNVNSQNVTSYSIGLKNQPIITEEMNKNLSYNKQTFMKENSYKDYKFLNILSDSEILATTSRVIENYSRVYKDNVIAYDMDSIGNSISEVRFIPKSTVELTGIQEFIITVYIEDASKLKNITLNIPKEGGGSWERSGTDLKNGWNRIRLFTNEGNLDNWTQARMFRILLYMQDGAQTRVTISDFKAVRPDKAKLIMVNDHGYSNYKSIAHERFKKLGIPTTFAINPGRLNAPIPGASHILSQEEINELAVDPYAEFSYHAWDPTVKASANMTVEELKQELAQCKHYLKLNGIYPDFFWRAAFVQNKAPNHDAINDRIEAYAQYNESSQFDAFPFKTTYGINRKQVHNIDNTKMDVYFDTLKKTHCLVVFYTHDISDDGGIHMTTAELDYFESKLKTGIEEGWLEPTTYAELRRKYQSNNGKRIQEEFYENI